MRTDWLMTLYQATKNFRLFHEFFRVLIIEVEVPLLRLMLSGYSAQVFTRNSLHTSGKFNLFMSDIDLSIVTNEPEQIQKFLHECSKQKKIFLNLGECEFYTVNEWTLKSRLERSDLYIFWEKTYLTRKLVWQKNSMSKAETEYEQSKHLRAMGVTRQRLGLKNDKIRGDDLFPFIADDCPPAIYANTERYSDFLELNLGIEENADLIFQSADHFERFSLCLPDDIHWPQSEFEKELKKFLMLNELLMCLTSERLHRAQGNFPQATKIASWIQEMHARGCPTVAEALKTIP